MGRKTARQRKTHRIRKTRVRGTYALVLYLLPAQTIRVGKLGAFKFPRG